MLVLYYFNRCKTLSFINLHKLLDCNSCFVFNNISFVSALTE